MATFQCSDCHRADSVASNCENKSDLYFCSTGIKTLYKFTLTNLSTAFISLKAMITNRLLQFCVCGYVVHSNVYMGTDSMTIESACSNSLATRTYGNSFTKTPFGTWKAGAGSLVSLANLEKSIWKNVRDNSNSKYKLRWFTLIFKLLPNALFTSVSKRKSGYVKLTHRLLTILTFFTVSISINNGQRYQTSD